MKVVHIPFAFAPDPVGGTEVYVSQLARDLQQLHVDAIVAAPAERADAYTIDDLRVYRFARSTKIIDVSHFYGAGDLLAAGEFAKILDEEKPDLAHVHAFTPAVSLELIRAAKIRGLPVVFTYHTPTVSCQRGTLMAWGKSICDGRLEVRRCTGCSLNGLGIHQLSAVLLGALSPAVGRGLEFLGLQGGGWTALRMSDLVRMRHGVFRQMALEVDHIVAVCDWVRDVLILNQVPAAKVSVSRHGISWRSSESHGRSLPPIAGEPGRLRLAFLGRLDPTKGVHILIEALKLVPTLGISLDIYGIVQNSGSAGYREKVMAMSAGDRRIVFKEPLPTSETVPRLREYDFLVIPSQWLETGPLVALEAFAAGIPVIGWNIGGIGEIVRHGKDGYLIEPGPVERWADALRCVTEDTKLRAQLKAGVRPPRNSMDVAREMLTLYKSLLHAQMGDAR